MTSWIELSLAAGNLPKQRLHMNPSSRIWIEQYCESNDGYIEVINDNDEEDDYQPNIENGIGGVISGVKERAKKIGVKKASPKSSKLNNPEISKCNVSVLKLLPNAPKNAVVPATLSKRKKGRHHAGGWHHRTIMESTAAKKLTRRIDPEIKDMMPIVAKLVAEARQITLRLIAEEDTLTLEQSLKDIVEKLDNSTSKYEIVDNCVLVRKDMPPERPVDLEEVQVELEGMERQIPRELLEMFNTFIARKLGQSCKRKRGDDDEGMNEGGEMENSGLMEGNGVVDESGEMEVDLF